MFGMSGDAIPLCMLARKTVLGKVPEDTFSQVAGLVIAGSGW